MANLRGIMKKLQTAILHEGLVVKVNTFQFYSCEQKRMINKYQVSTPTLHKLKTGRWKEQDYELLSTCSPADVINCLNDIYRAVRNE